MAQRDQFSCSGTNLIINQNSKNIQNALFKGLNIFILNINRLKNKINDLEFLLYTLNFNPDIIVLIETWLNENEAKFVNISGYNRSYYCRRKLRGGGIMVLVKENIDFEEIPVDSRERVEFVLLNIKTFNLKLCASYKAPLGDNNVFFANLNKILEKHKDIIVVGDTNLNLLEDSHTTRHYNNVLSSNNLILLNDINDFSYTRKHSSNSISIIDHASSSLSHKFKHKLIIGDHHLSDHRFLIVSLEAVRQQKQNSEFFIKTNFNKVSESLESAPTNSFDHFHDFLKSSIEINTAEVSKTLNKTSFKKPWFDLELKLLKKQRDKFYKLKLKFPDNQHFHITFTELKKALRLEIQKKKRDYYSSKVSSNIDNPKKLWSCFNEIISNKNSSPKTSNITLKNCSPNNSAANIFNRHFISVGQLNCLTSTSSSNFILPTPTTQILKSFNKSTPECIRKIILSLKNDSSAGEDRMKAPFLKNNIEYFSTTLSKFINDSIDLGKFPNSLKKAKVVPIFKSGDRQDVSNFRPISILPLFSKVFESFLRDQLLSHLQINNIISPQQFGFLKGCSTTSAAISLTHKIFNNKGSGLKTSCLFLDLHKAFDTLNHGILRRLLEEMGIRDNALNLISDYLSERSQFVEVNGEKSDVLSISHGVPQGSILGPFLFLIYINNLIKLPLHGSLQCYADDTAIVYGENDYTTLKRKMTEDLTLIDTFLSSINLKLNPSKSKYIIFKSINTNPLNYFNSISFNNKIINSTQIYDYLGLVIDEKLTFSEHINKIMKRIAPYLGVLPRIRYSLNRANLMKIYYSYIHSHITYLLPFWSVAPKCYLKSLSFFQNKVMRVINFKPYDFSTELLYNESILSFNQLQNYETILLIFKILNNLIRSPVPLSTNIQNTGRVTRTCYELRTPNSISISSQKSVIYRGIKLFNDLPVALRSITSMSQFKKNLKEYVFNKFQIKPE